MVNSIVLNPKLTLISKVMLADSVSIRSIDRLELQELTGLAIEHGVAALLYDSLAQKEVREELYSSLAKFQIHQHLRNQLLDKVFRQTLTQLATLNVEFVVLKGFAVGYTIYPNHLLRTKSDVDIIIPCEHKESVIAAFESMDFYNPRGWSPNSIISQFSMRKTLSPGLNVDFDIHLRLSNELGVENILTFDELRTSADTITLQDVPMVSKPHALIHAIVHLLHHRNVGDTVKLIWLYDLLLLCQKMTNSDEAHFRKCVDEKGLGKLAIFALNIANQYFEDERIKAVVETLDGLSTNTELDYLMRVDSRSRHFRRSLNQRKSVREKWLFIKEMAFPPAQEIYQKYGKQPHYLMPFFYIRRLIGGVTKHLFN